MEFNLEVLNSSGVLLVRDAISGQYVNSNASGLQDGADGAMRYLAVSSVDNSLPGVSTATDYMNYKLPEIATSLEANMK